MVSASITRSTSIRLAAFYIALFLLSFLGANLAAYNMVAAYLYERLDSDVMERFREISSALTWAASTVLLRWSGAMARRSRGKRRFIR